MCLHYDESFLTFSPFYLQMGDMGAAGGGDGGELKMPDSDDESDGDSLPDLEES